MTSIARSPLPLSGVRVVDFGQYIAGPAVAMILGDLGATVVHVDPPGGPLWDNPANAILNRSKLIVTLDLKTEKGLDEAKALVAEADIVVENFRPGVLARLGIDFAALRKARPELITLSIPGFASDDELRRDWRAFETVIAASSGVFTDTPGRTSHYWLDETVVATPLANEHKNSNETKIAPRSMRVAV